MIVSQKQGLTLVPDQRGDTLLVKSALRVEDPELVSGCQDWEAAGQHFLGAIELDERMQAWPWLAHSRCELAGMLLAKGLEQDRERAYALLAEASSAAHSMGMAFLEEKIAALRDRYGHRRA